MIRILFTAPESGIEASVIKDGIPWKTISIQSRQTVLDHSRALLEFLEEYAGAAATLADDQLQRYDTEFRERCHLLCRLLRFEEEGLFALPEGEAFDLYVPPTLNGIPFELALGIDYLAIRFSVMRTFQGDQVDRKYSPARTFYGFNASADPALYGGREFKEKSVYSRLQSLSPDVRFKHGKAIERSALLKHLSTVDSVVLTTHGLPDRFLLANGAIEARDLAMIRLENVKFFLNNSCYGTADGPQTIGQMLLKSGVEHYTGHITRVALDRSARIAESILDGLSAGKNLREAVHAARLTSFRENAREPAWASLQYFGRGTLQCSPKAESRKPVGRSILWKAAAVAVVVLGTTVLVGKILQGQKTNPVTESEAPAPDERVPPAGDVREHPSRERPASTALGCKTESDCSAELRRAIQKFRAAPHPIYNKQDKEHVIAEILDSQMTERNKVIAIQNEIP